MPIQMSEKNVVTFPLLCSPPNLLLHVCTNYSSFSTFCMICFRAINLTELIVCMKFGYEMFLQTQVMIIVTWFSSLVSTYFTLIGQFLFTLYPIGGNFTLIGPFLFTLDLIGKCFTLIGHFLFSFNTSFTVFALVGFVFSLHTYHIIYLVCKK